MVKIFELASHLQSGDEFKKKGKYIEACEEYKKAYDIKSVDLKASAYANWGSVLYTLEKYDEAVEKYQTAVEKDPVNSYFDWGNTLADLHWYDEAIKKYKITIKFDSYYAYAYHNIAYCLWRQGKYKVGWEEWEKTRRVYDSIREKKTEISKNVDYFQYYGYVLHEIFGELNEAEKIYKEGLVMNPDHIGVLTGLVNLYLEKKDIHSDDKTSVHWKARRYFKKIEGILRNLTEEPSTSLQLGKLYLTMEEYKEAEIYLTKALGKDKESAEIYTNLGVLYTKKEDLKRAVQYFEAALRRDSEDLIIRSNLAGALLKAGRKEKAEAEYENILRITHDHVESHIGLGEVYTAMGDDGNEEIYDQAIYHFNEGMKISKEGRGSKILKKKELAAALYSSGYAKVKLYETSKMIKDEGLLHNALKDFKECLNNDSYYHKAKRAKEKIEKRSKFLTPQRFAEKVGPGFVFFSSFFVFTLSQLSFIFGEPKYIDVNYYGLFTFSSFIFMVTGLYLPQILKLKVGSIELEKGPVEQITAPTSLGISR